MFTFSLRAPHKQQQRQQLKVIESSAEESGKPLAGGGILLPVPTHRFIGQQDQSTASTEATEAEFLDPIDASVMFSDSPPTTQVFIGFLQTGANTFKKDFYNLKLTDREYRVLYEAAKCIHKSYKGRKSRIKEQDKMSKAAVKKVPNRWRSLGCHVWRERGSGQFFGGASRSTARYCKKQHSPQQQHHMNNQDGSSKEPSRSKPLWTPPESANKSKSRTDGDDFPPSTGKRANRRHPPVGTRTKCHSYRTGALIPLD
ncbi:calmodulin-binding transcription activator [Culex quinquefasciatus]|uniref:Calmodulin-binding transcription activator n=1 Tax=Culex quinquefasciatus TaxID=7176 RepID=B0XJT4_CULQU|nr:calmodulin-binding transcription activator [Culex quinquefasciatus]|eukprot:XP_001869906.1 calmodulin-binding transcription activator [Culex quinquefasciatus]